MNISIVATLLLIFGVAVAAQTSQQEQQQQLRQFNGAYRSFQAARKNRKLVDSKRRLKGGKGGKGGQGDEGNEEGKSESEGAAKAGSKGSKGSKNGIDSSVSCETIIQNCTITLGSYDSLYSSNNQDEPNILDFGLDGIDAPDAISDVLISLEMKGDFDGAHESITLVHTSNTTLVIAEFSGDGTYPQCEAMEYFTWEIEMDVYNDEISDGTFGYQVIPGQSVGMCTESIARMEIAYNITGCDTCP